MNFEVREMMVRPDVKKRDLGSDGYGTAIQLSLSASPKKTELHHLVLATFVIRPIP